MPITAYPFIPYLQQDLVSSGAYAQRTYVKVFGKSTTVGTTSAYYDLWMGNTTVYRPPSTAISMQIVSSSTSDTSGGSGVQQVTINYLDSSYNPQTIVVTMNGTTAVSLGVSVLRVNKMYASTVGSTGYPVGNITLQNNAGTIQYAYIEAGRNSAQQVYFTVPANKTFYLSQWSVSAGPSANTTAKSSISQVVVRATAWNSYTLTGANLGTNPTQGFLTADECGIVAGTQNYVLTDPIKIPAQTDVKMSVLDSSGVASIVVGTFLGWYE